ncbi:MAG: HicB family protein [Treponema sp.]|nr:MAG: HicB family protein [Treponema sp.]
MNDVYSMRLKISQIENGQYLAESDDMPGLIAQGRSISETIEIAQDVARKLLESYIEHGDPIPVTFKPIEEKIELDIAVGV